MKSLILILAFSGIACAVTPDCNPAPVMISNDPSINANGVQVFPVLQALPPINNNLGGSACQAWTIFYSFSGFSYSSVQVETASASSGPYVVFPGVVNYGANPYTFNRNGWVNLTGTYNYLRFNSPFILGTGSVLIQAFGWINPSNVGSIVNYPTNSGTGSVTSFGTGSWVSWEMPTVTAATTTPSLSVAGATGLTSHEVVGTCGSSTTAALCALVAGDIPALSYLTSFAAPSGNWPSWLTPTVTNSTTTPSLAVAAATGQTSHKVIGTCGTATSFAPCSLVLGDLPSSLFTLTTSGSSGAATYSGGTLNIPQYSGSGSSAFNAITSGTNTTAAMLVGTGSSLGVTGSGTIAATSVPVAGVTSLTFTGNTTKAASSTGALTSGDCAKWDASGNVIDAGLSCASAVLPSGSGIVEVTSGVGGLVNIGASGALVYTTGTQTLDVATSVVPLFGNSWAVPNLVTLTQQPNSATNCASSASPAVCGSAWAGRVVVAAASGSVVVDTTAVTANSEIQITFDSSLGTALSVTCNTTYDAPYISARTAGTSFTISAASNPSTNPACYSYTIHN